VPASHHHRLRKSHIVLTSHPHFIYRDSPEVQWGAADPHERGPIIASFTNKLHRNAIGSHSGSYTIYRALALAAGQMDPEHRPDLTNTDPVAPIGPFPSWNGDRIVSLDPWGHLVHQVFRKQLAAGMDIRPTIAVTRAHLVMTELQNAVSEGRLAVDGTVVKANNDVAVTKAAIEPVWFLPGVAKRFGIEEIPLRKALFEETGGMFPELITRPDLSVMLPPIGSTSIYIFGDSRLIGRRDVEVTVRVHDECNGSDVFGSDICTCRPYLVHGIEECIKTAQRGGIGYIVYFRKEGRALGEVTKFLVYNARKRQRGGDSAATYFHRTECVAGVQDMRFQELMPDALHWLGIRRIDNLISMSNMKHDAIVESGIEVVRRYEIPPEKVPKDAAVEMEAKKAAGYFNTTTGAKRRKDLVNVKGRKLDE
jgi:GTP cyclohydrolase II